MCDQSYKNPCAPHSGEIACINTDLEVLAFADNMLQGKRMSASSALKQTALEHIFCECLNLILPKSHPV